MNEAPIVIVNDPAQPCLRPNPARADGVWPSGPFYMVGNAIYFHWQDAVRAARAHERPAD